MIDALLGAMALVIDKVASKIPGLTGLPWDRISGAFAKFAATIALWMDVFPWMWHVLAAAGAMMTVLIAKIAWYWLNWLVKKIPFVGG